MVNNNDKVALTLSRNEALVLYDFLARFEDSDTLSIQDQAESRVLWNICSDLERSIAELLTADYFALLQEARDKIRDSTSE